MLTTVFKDIANILLKSAPSFAKAISGPISSIALAILSQAFDVKSKDSDELVKKISDDAEAETKLCSLEETYANAFRFITHYVKPPSSIELKISWDHD